MGKSTPENVVVVVCPVTRFRNKPVPYRWRSQRQGGSNKHGNSPTRLQKSATANERESFLPRLLPTTTCSRAAGEARRRRILVFVWKMQRVYCELFFLRTPQSTHMNQFGGAGFAMSVVVWQTFAGFTKRPELLRS